MLQDSIPRKELKNHNESTEAERVGSRIREIRVAKNLSRAELGEKVGLNRGRIQQYEKGTRRPRPELLKQIAVALDVEVAALAEPAVTNPIGAMYALFAMEKYYGLKVQCHEGQINLVFDNSITGLMNIYLYEWEKECRQVKSDLEAPISDKERAEIVKAYNMWKWSFPRVISDRTDHDLKKLKRMRLEENIRQLKEELAKLDDE